MHRQSLAAWFASAVFFSDALASFSDFPSSGHQFGSSWPQPTYEFLIEVGGVGADCPLQVILALL